jgi:CRP-like cAMP-binding protein
MDHPTADDLARVPLLADLTDEARLVLADRFEVEEFDTGRQLVTEGRAGYSFYLLDRGKVSVTHEGREVRTLSAGDFFGGIAILGDDRAARGRLEPGGALAWWATRRTRGTDRCQPIPTSPTRSTSTRSWSCGGRPMR